MPNITMTIDEAKAYIEKLRTEYIENHKKSQERDELIGENAIEQRDVNGYHGREILELLQNADDAYQKSIESGEKPSCDLEVYIEYKDNCLTVTNTGTAFDRDGIKAIVQGNNSPKSGKYIGNKGTGFRSVLNWAESVEVISGPFSLRFSKEYANAIFEEIKDEPQIQKQLARRSNLYIPILAVPEFIETEHFLDKTIIRIHLDSNKLNDDFSVSKQLDNIDLRILLFLPNISRIVIDANGEKIIYQRIVDEKTGYILLQKMVNAKVTVEEEFYLFKKTIPAAIEEDRVMKDIQLAVAVPLKIESFEPSYLYSYFPLLNTRSPFNCVMHASYVLSDHRDTLNRGDENKRVIKEQLDFLIEIAEVYLSKKQHEIALSLLLPNEFDQNPDSCLSAFDVFDLQEYYFERIKDIKILQTVNDEYISIQDNPWIIEGGFPKCFCGEPFSNLLTVFADERHEQFVEYLCDNYDIDTLLSEKELFEKINEITYSLNVSQQVEVFAWWNKNSSRKSLPKLLKTQEGDWIGYGVECYFLTGSFEDITIPSWVKVPALDMEYQKQLFEVAEKNSSIISAREREGEKETHISRLISQKNIYPTIKFNYRDRYSIIPTINASIEDVYERAVEFVKWLWDNNGDTEDWLPPRETTFHFPCTREKGVSNSELLFFGTEYGNELSEKLFVKGYQPFVSYELFDVDKKDLDKFVEFIGKFGVKTYPSIRVQAVDPIDSYEDKLENEILANAYVGTSRWVTARCSLTTIQGLEEILSSLSTLDIIKWIQSDTALYANMGNLYDTQATIKYSGSSQRSWYYYNGKIRNYILEVFNETKWIEFPGWNEKYSPRQVLRFSRYNQKFATLLPIVDDVFLVNIANSMNVDVEEVSAIFQLFDICNKVTDLSSNDFYGLLLNISELSLEKGAPLYEIIYRIVEQPDFIRRYEDCDKKKQYQAKGKLLVEYHGTKQYIKATEAYLPSSKILNKSNFPIVVKGSRTNNENFVRVFFCNQYKKDYRIIFDSIEKSDANNEFQKYFASFQKFAMAYSERNANIGKSKDITITLVKKICVLEGEDTVEIKDEYILLRDTQTNWYVTAFGENFDINSISAIVENIYLNIANTPGFDVGKIGELFRTKDTSNREFLIRKEFGSLDVIDDSYYQNEIKNNFVSVLQKLNVDIDDSEIDIDFDHFSSTVNAEKIIKIFKRHGITIQMFKENGFLYTIDLKPYYSEKARELVVRERRVYKNAKYNQAYLDPSLQSDFIRTCYEFENFRIEFDSITDLINLCVEEIFIARFGRWNDVVCELDAEDEYQKNYVKMNSDRLFEDEISNNESVRTMIYFEQSDKFKAWLESQRKTENLEIEDDPYAKYRDVVPEEADITYTTPGERPSGSRGGDSRGVYTQSASDKRARERKIIGNKGELLIYNLLCERYGEDHVYPRSEAFVELGILKAGQAISGEYDISYLDGNGVEFFVEVKTGSSNSFSISEKELSFAMEFSNKYQLFVVYDLDKEIPQYEEIPMEFWNNANFRRTDIIERIEYHF